MAGARGRGCVGDGARHAAGRGEQGGRNALEKPRCAGRHAHPKVGSFDLDLTAVPLFSSFVLVAVVMSASNQISPADLVISPGSNPTTVDQLVTTSPHVAARSVALVV